MFRESPNASNRPVVASPSSPEFAVTPVGSFLGNWFGSGFRPSAARPDALTRELARTNRLLPLRASPNRQFPTPGTVIPRGFLFVNQTVKPFPKPGVLFAGSPPKTALPQKTTRSGKQKKKKMKEEEKNVRSTARSMARSLARRRMQLGAHFPRLDHLATAEDHKGRGEDQQPMPGQPPASRCRPHWPAGQPPHGKRQPRPPRKPAQTLKGDALITNKKRKDQPPNRWMRKSRCRTPSKFCVFENTN